MRITNKIMQRNNLSNINTNKIYQDQLSTQMSTQKKINRPSDDPVVAIRALRLRSNVTEVTQYYTKNIPDAESWLKVTEESLNNLSQIITNMISRCTKGSQGDLQTKDRQIILEELKALGEEIYSTGDADYAGRYVFTGYRTDTSLSFPKETELKYSITEQLGIEAIDTLSYVDTGKLLDINSSNFDTVAVDETQITATDVYRIRLAYKDCDANGTAPTITYIDPTATPPEQTMTATRMSLYGTDTDAVTGETDPYKAASDSNNKDAVIFVPETGEILLGEESYKKLMAVKDREDTTIENEGEIKVTYEKSHWDKGNLRPQHYFACTTTDANGKTIDYNQEYLKGHVSHQEIEYDVGFNQTIRVNSTADECFRPGIGREANDLVNAMQDVLDLEATEATLKKLQEENAGDAAKSKTIQDQLDAVGKALTYAKQKEQSLFEKGITTFQKYLDDANLCITNCGTRSSKLALIKNRMQNQKTTFETLKSENEDADITEVAINLNSAELTYEAALMATGKVMQTSLLNFI
ncbi:MAG: flagellar hook-associated protein FlgL [Lachnospiraceae bacterium]|nr:flagellar hook-associated protein FlgL [Lachnospiraceae bacterium]MCM1239622.1 flagellar hook-associated protein FlgL [Lachnospiraceae bacterium]